MTKVLSIGTKTDKAADKRVAEIAKLRELFDPAYRPQFRPGDIVRYRPTHRRLLHVKEIAACMYVVIAVRREGESWRGFQYMDPEDDVRVLCISFEKEQQRETAGAVASASWEFELVEAYRDPSEAP